jgi:PEP-CTERM motif
MSSLSFRALHRALPTAALITVGLLLAVPNGPARAALIVDPLGDFLPTYTGPQDPGLDVLAHEVTLVGDRMNFFGRMAGPIAPTQTIGGLYLIGVDRGQGTPRFLNSPAAPPIIGPNVLWDLIVRLNANGTGAVVNSLLGITTTLAPADIAINGNDFTVSVPLSLMLPAATRPPEEWTYNLWPRNGVGLNVQVSDLAPDDGNSPVHTIPEPASLALLALGLPFLTWRRSQRSGTSITV